MDPLTGLILACSVYFDDRLVRALVEVTSHGNPYSVIDGEFDPTSGDPPPAATNIASARDALIEVHRKGGAPLAGLMPVPEAWAAVFGREAGELFDGCTNISIATAMLSSFERDCARGSPSLRRGHGHGTGNRPPTRVGPTSCVLRKYAEAIHFPAVVDVVRLQLSFGHRLEGSTTNAPIVYNDTAGQDRNWGMDRILFQTTTSSRAGHIP